MNLSDDEVINYIENFVYRKGEEYDWDDFTAMPIKDQFLDWVRKESISVHDRFPPESGEGYCSQKGLDYLLSLVNKIQERKGRV